MASPQSRCYEVLENILNLKIFPTIQGKSTFDPACAQAARVYASSGAPGPLQDALVAFLDASILNSDGGNAYIILHKITAIIVNIIII